MEVYMSALTDPAGIIVRDDVDELSRRFAAATPFPHVVMEGVLSSEPELESAFPPVEWDGWHRYGDAFQPGKRICNDLSAIPEPLRAVIFGLQSPGFLAMLERITGVTGLIPDPYLDGGGLHASDPGGVLEPHTDFHVYPRLGLYRRVNLLLYLNSDWGPDDGGELELFADRQATVVAERVLPEYGRCVIFRTDDQSVHGFTRPVTRERRSIALYYYTARDTSAYGGSTTTMWRRRVDSSRGVRALVHRWLLLSSRALSRCAHLTSPVRER
jgi:hypothetical protein